MSVKNKLSTTRLRRQNFMAAGMHFIQGLAVLLISKNFAVPITGTYLKFDKVSKHLYPTTKTLFNVQLAWLIVAFFFLSAIFHLFIILDGS